MTVAITYKSMRNLAIAWLALPVMLFVSGWLRIWLAMPLVALIAYSLWRVFRSDAPHSPLNIKVDFRFVCICICMLGWYWLSGIGGYAQQDAWDHNFRNAIFNDLVNNPWPVVGSEDGRWEMLCYFFAYWLPAALVAKAFHSLEAGYAFQFIYGLVGVALAFLMLCRWLNGVKLRYCLIFILFGGCDILMKAYAEGSVNILELRNAELVYGYFCSAPITVQLYFIYNSAIAAWLACLIMVYVNRNPGYMVMVVGMLSLFSPFVCVGLAFYVLYILVRNLRRTITVENITGCLIGVIAILFFRSNMRVEGAALTEPDLQRIVTYLLFLLLNFGCYIAFLYHRVVGSKLFMLTFVPILLLMWIHLCDTDDFAWRIVIPSAFYLMMYVMEYLRDFRLRGARNIAFAVVLAIAVLPSLRLIGERLKMTVTAYYMNQPESMRASEITTTFAPSVCHDNFISTGHDSFFCRYLLRENTQQ